MELGNITLGHQENIEMIYLYLVELEKEVARLETELAKLENE